MQQSSDELAGRFDCAKGMPCRPAPPLANAIRYSRCAVLPSLPHTQPSTHAEAQVAQQGHTDKAANHGGNGAHCSRGGVYGG